MKYILTAQEILEKYDWSKFCSIRDIDFWAMKEGKIEPDKEFILTEKELDQIYSEDEKVCDICGRNYDNCICATREGGFRR